MEQVPVTSGKSASSSVKAGWQAHLQLHYAQDGERTYIQRKSFQGPLTLQKPFYPEGGTCHTYLLHPPGGIVAGDQLHLDLHLGSNTHVLATTPAANKFYRSQGEFALLKQTLRLEQGASLEFLPQETILFNDSRCQIQTQIYLTPASRFIYWDVFCLGRPAAKETYQSGTCRQSLQILKANKPILTDRLNFHGGSESLKAAWGLNAATSFAYLVAGEVNREMVQALKASLTTNPEHRLALTQIENLMICRYLGYHAEEAKAKFMQVWEALRPMLLQKPACAPRIWRT